MSSNDSTSMKWTHSMEVYRSHLGQATICLRFYPATSKNWFWSMNSDNKLYKLNQQEEPYSNYQLFLTWVLQIVEYSLIIGGINSHREKRKKENPGGGGRKWKTRRTNWIREWKDISWDLNDSNQAEPQLIVHKVSTTSIHLLQIKRNTNR